MKAALFGCSTPGLPCGPPETDWAFFVTVSRMDGRSASATWIPGATARRRLAGLAKTAGWEWPEVQCKAIDLADDLADADPAADAMFEENFCWPAPRKWACSRRRSADLRMHGSIAVRACRRLSFAPGDLIVATGGAAASRPRPRWPWRGRSGRRWCCFGRTPEPAREPDWLAPLTSEAEIKRELGNAPMATPRPRSSANNINL